MIQKDIIVTKLGTGRPQNHKLSLIHVILERTTS